MSTNFMLLKEYINNKIAELKHTGLYKEVIFQDAKDVDIAKNTVSENYLSPSSYLNTICREVVNRGELPEQYQKGSKVMIQVLKKRKRNYDTLYYYVIYT